MQRAQLADRQAAAVGVVGAGSVAATRIASAPAGYVLAHDISDIARHCELLERRPGPGDVNVVVTPSGRRDRWRVDVASMDRPGLLAALTGGLADRRLDVVQAVVATWDDGVALDAFIVHCDRPPDPGALQRTLREWLRRPLISPAVTGAEATFDDDASPIYTRCDIRAPDQRGLLHSLSVALAAVGADIHGASVTTVDGVALDRFDLSGQGGRKLSEAHRHGIRSALAEGVSLLRLGAGRRPGSHGW